MEKFWSLMGKIAIIIGILGFFGVNEVHQFLPFQVIDTGSSQNSNTILDLSKPDFQFGDVKLNYLNTTKPFFYNGSTNLICYSFYNPNNRSEENFTLIGEWFIQNNQTPYYEYKENLSYNDIFNTSRLNWIVISSDSENKDNVRFRVALGQDVKSLSNEIDYEIKFNNSLLPYLENENSGLITWDNQIVKDFVSQTNICSYSSEENLIRTILKTTQNFMNKPAETKEILKYDEELVDSKDSWKNKIGTSSEYSAVFAMLLRISGIPSKLEINYLDGEEYYYVEYYSDKGEWRPVDVYGDYGNFGNCFNINVLKKDQTSKDVCVESLKQYISFQEITPSDFLGWPEIKGVIKNVYDSDLKSYCIKVDLTFYDELGNEIYLEKGKYLSPDEKDYLEKGGSANFKLLVTEDLDYDKVEIKLNEFSQTCL